MLRLVKKAAAAKNIPLLALALFAAVFIGNEVYASLQGFQTQQWIYNPACGNPADPNCYSPATGSLETDCLQQLNVVCGINAPLDESSENEIPLIENQLLTDLQSGNFVGKPNIFRMPYAPN